MIKAKDIPEPSMHAAEAAWSNDATWPQILAAAINAWPKALIITERDGDYMSLPLPPEKGNR